MVVVVFGVQLVSLEVAAFVREDEIVMVFGVQLVDFSLEFAAFVQEDELGTALLFGWSTDWPQDGKKWKKKIIYNTYK